MKYSIIFAALIGILIFTGLTYGQRDYYIKITTLDIDVDGATARESGGIDSVVIQYTGLENPNLQLFEVAIPARTKAACMASRDFSAAVPVGPERALQTYDAETGTYSVRWNVERPNRNSCRVLLARTAGGSGDYAIWQSSYGAGGLFAEELIEGDLPRSNAVSVTRVRSTYTVTFGGTL